MSCLGGIGNSLSFRNGDNFFDEENEEEFPDFNFNCEIERKSSGNDDNNYTYYEYYNNYNHLGEYFCNQARNINMILQLVGSGSGSNNKEPPQQEEKKKNKFGRFLESTALKEFDEDEENIRSAIV